LGEPDGDEGCADREGDEKAEDGAEEDLWVAVVLVASDGK
jgi:hypothetical protein